MKIDLRSLEPVSHTSCNGATCILFCVTEKKIKLRPSGYYVYKLCTNLKDDKATMYLLMVGIYKVGIPEEWLKFMDAIAQVIKGQDIMDLDVVYTLMKSLLYGDALQVSRTKRQFKRRRTAQHLLHILLW
eukprot:13879660-Ditylum_brightwellii.AAC.1